MVQAAHILVGGGTGFVGRHLVQLLKHGGAKVRVITRKPNSADQISWSAIKASGLPKDTTAVVNLAGRNILDIAPWTESYKREVYTSRIETNKALVDAIHKAENKPKTFVTVSGVGYYEPHPTKTYTESWTQPAGMEGDYLMKLARDWEKAGELDEQLAPSTRRVIIRSGVVIGPDGGVIQNLKFPFTMGAGGPIGSGNQWFPWIHVDDLANMFKFAITNDHVTGVINGVAPQLAKNKEFASALGKSLNRPAFVPLPALFVRLLFGPDRADVLLKGQCVKSRAEHLGFRYLQPTLARACQHSISRIKP